MRGCCSRIPARRVQITSYGQKTRSASGFSSAAGSENNYSDTEVVLTLWYVVIRIIGSRPLGRGREIDEAGWHPSLFLSLETQVLAGNA